MLNEQDVIGYLREERDCYSQGGRFEEAGEYDWAVEKYLRGMKIADMFHDMGPIASFGRGLDKALLDWRGEVAFDLADIYLKGNGGIEDKANSRSEASSWFMRGADFFHNTRCMVAVAEYCTDDESFDTRDGYRAKFLKTAIRMGSLSIEDMVKAVGLLDKVGCGKWALDFAKESGATHWASMELALSLKYIKCVK